MIRQRSLRWSLLAVGCMFGCLGLLFLAAPAPAARLFGIASADPDGHSYIQALSLRDVALGAYLALLTLYASVRAVLIVLVVTLVIPVGDLLLVATAPDGELIHMLLHLASGLLFAGLAMWVWTTARADLGPRRG